MDCVVIILQTSYEVLPQAWAGVYRHVSLHFYVYVETGSLHPTNLERLN
jgi:hypothetical protein